MLLRILIPVILSIVAIGFMALGSVKTPVWQPAHVVAAGRKQLTIGLGIWVVAVLVLVSLR